MADLIRDACLPGKIKGLQYFLPGLFDAVNDGWRNKLESYGLHAFLES